MPPLLHHLLIPWLPSATCPDHWMWYRCSLSIHFRLPNQATPHVVQLMVHWWCSVEHCPDISFASRSAWWCTIEHCPSVSPAQLGHAVCPPTYSSLMVFHWTLSWRFICPTMPGHVSKFIDGALLNIGLTFPLLYHQCALCPGHSPCWSLSRCFACSTTSVPRVQVISTPCVDLCPTAPLPTQVPPPIWSSQKHWVFFAYFLLCRSII